MRFKTAVRNINTFTKLAHSLERVGKRCLLRLTPDTIHFIIIPDYTGTQVWAALGVETLFEDYHIQSAADDCINLEIPVDNLHRALRSAGNANEVIIRLTRRDRFAVLSFCISVAGRTGTNTITHHVTVRVLNQSYISTLREPQCPEPDVHIVLPPLSGLKAISERFKTLADRILIKANMNGEMKLRAESDSVKIETAWKDLINPELDPAQILEPGRHPSQIRDKTAFASVRVDARDWLNFLRVHVVAKRVIACMQIFFIKDTLTL